MKIQKYQGKDTKEVMAQVRAQFGADAYVLGTRRVRDRIEITVASNIDEALEDDTGSAPLRQVPRAKAKPATLKAATAITAGARPRVAPTSELQLAALEKELHRLRSILDDELGQRSWRDVASQPPVSTTLRQRLLRLGLSRTLSGSLLDRIPTEVNLERGWRLVMASLVRRIRTATPALGPGAVTAVYGGTGVGKTSTIAKLASRDVRTLGVEAVGLVTLDAYRLGAQEQIATFASALGLPVVAAQDAQSLSVALRKLEGRRIYIDTAGMAQRDGRLVGQRVLVDTICPSAEHLLVMAASSQPGQNRALVEAFTPSTLSGVIISKVDEAQSLGGVIDVMLQADLALYGVADGQRIPEDLRDADAADLLEQALRLAPPGHSASRSPGASQGLRFSA